MAYQAQNFVDIIKAAMSEANALIIKQGRLSKRVAGQSNVQINVINYFNLIQAPIQKDKRSFKVTLKIISEFLCWVGIFTSPYLAAFLEVVKNVLNTVS